MVRIDSPEVQEFEKERLSKGIAREAKELGKSVFLVGMGRTPGEPKYELPIEGEGDVCIYVLSRNSGESADRPGGEGDYVLTGDEVRHILACAGRNLTLSKELS